MFKRLALLTLAAGTACAVLCLGVSVYAKPKPASWIIRAAGAPLPSVSPVPASPVAAALNAASLEGLQEVPGVGPALARAVLRDRETNGPFFYPEDLTWVSGVGDVRYKAILDFFAQE